MRSCPRSVTLSSRSTKFPGRRRPSDASVAMAALKSLRSAEQIGEMRGIPMGRKKAAPAGELVTT